MKVFNHHVYEYKKGLRRLILFTTSSVNEKNIAQRLNKAGIEFLIYSVNAGKINVFFGSKVCVDVIKAINKPSLNEYTSEEDFILGTLLGYCREQQCERYLKMKAKTAKAN